MDAVDSSLLVDFQQRAAVQRVSDAKGRGVVAKQHIAKGQILLQCELWCVRTP